MSVPTRLPGLDALRGIAALLVVGLHTNAVFGGLPLFSRGYLAVDFFLMLSGYLMARITEPKLANGLTPGPFMVARYRRFWPMMALGSAIGVPYLWVRAGGDVAHFLPALIANFALLPWPLANLLFALNIPAWTIFAELLANALHVLCLRHLSIRSLSILTALLGVLTCWSALAWGSLDIGARPQHALAAIPRVLFAYCIGMALWRGGRAKFRLSLPAPLVLLALPLTLIGSRVVGLHGWWFDVLFVALICPAVILAGAGLRHQIRLGWLSGAVSFPLFAIHLPILEGVRELGGTVGLAVPLAVGAALVIVWWTNRRDLRNAAASV